MSQLLAMSFDVASSPTIKLEAVDRPDPDASQSDEPYGWGFAWYPAGDLAAMVIKDPTSIGTNAMTKLLRDWDRFQSTTFVCHIRGAAQRITQEDTHPFSRSYAGRDWIIAHSGYLHGDLAAELPLGEQPVFEPVGHTDTERVLCWLLTRIREAGARSLAAVGWQKLHEWFQRLDGLGEANFIFTDGEDVVAHYGTDCYNTLHWTRRVPPHKQTELRSSDLVLEVGGAFDLNRTYVLISSRPLGGIAGWQAMHGGQMLVVRRGSVIWDSHGDRPVQAVREAEPLKAPSETVPLETGLVGAAAGPVAQSQAQVQGPAGSQPPTAERVVAPMSPAPAPAFASPTGTYRVPRPGATRTLRVIHETTYRYTTPVENSSHKFRLQPVHDLEQQILEYHTEISAEGLRREYEDVFGNRVITLQVEKPFTEMKISSSSLVRLPRRPNHGLKSPHRRSTIPLVWMPWQRQMMTPYLLPPELPESQLRELSDFAMSFVERNDYDLAETLIDMNMTIYKDFNYVSGSTNLETTPFEVYVHRRGVCQDFANLLICMARLLNVPARYRVGYIYTGGNYENKIQSDASHAWVELYIPWIGWRGFDPTNGCLTGADHVRVACGRNFRDATPTQGTIYKGGGGETLLPVTVKVTEE